MRRRRERRKRWGERQIRGPNIDKRNSDGPDDPLGQSPSSGILIFRGIGQYDDKDKREMVVGFTLKCVTSDELF